MPRLFTLLLSLCLFSPLTQAGVITLDFDGFPDGTTLTNQYAGFGFANTLVVTEGLSLNELQFPPRSGTNVATDTGGPITIAFASPVLTFSGFFTYSSALSVEAFDSLDQSVGTTNSAFGSNVVSSGNPVNELLQVSFAGGIASLSITGNPVGSSFTLDDVTVTTPDSTAIPEPSAGPMIFLGFLIAAGARRVRIEL